MSGLHIWSFKARIAFSGQSALETSRVKPPNVVIMNVGMPQMDGLEAARRLRQEHPKHPMHLIAVTGHGVESASNKAIEAEFDLYLIKSADPQKIFQILNSLEMGYA